MGSQNEVILDHLINNHSINPVQALNEFKCFRLAARINDLRAAGYLILTRIEKKNGKRFAVYSLSK